MAFNYEFPYTDPNFYNDDWLLTKVKGALERLQAVEDWENSFQEAYDELMQLVADFEAGKLPQGLEKGLYKWMQAHAIDLVGSLVSLVFFTINDDGYWVAHIPEGWDEIIFNTTDLDIAIPGIEYGHLVLSYNI